MRITLSSEGESGALLDVLVVGGGQAGLALGHHLRRTSLRFLIVDAAPEVGHVWRTRYDSLRLFTPAKRDALPGLPFPGNPEHYPSKDEVADYLTEYVRVFHLPLRLGVRVTALAASGGGYAAETSAGILWARQVVVATGPFGTPWVPDFACHFSLPQLHSSAYRRPTQLPPGRILVVGSGNSGAQIAEELTLTHEVTLALGRPQPFLPQRVLSRDVFDWAEKVPLFDAPVTAPLGHLLRWWDPVIGTNAQALARRGRLTFRPRADGGVGHTVHFQDGSAAVFDGVVWATGYRPDYGWLHVPVLDDQGRPRHARGVTAAPGLYFLGLSWQHTRRSALLGGVREDAAFIARRVEADHRDRAGRPLKVGLGPGKSGSRTR